MRDHYYQYALRVFVVVPITILAKHSGSSGRSAQRNVITHKVNCHSHIDLLFRYLRLP